MKESAKMMFKAGNIQEFCEISMQLGEYEKAIASAPKVSMQYWNKCVQRYTKHLEYKDKGEDPNELVSLYIL